MVKETKWIKKRMKKGNHTNMETSYLTEMAPNINT